MKHFSENNCEFSEEEMRVAQILLELPSLIYSPSEFNLENWTFSLTWGTKRRRSALNGRGPSLLSCQVKAKALSPATPLSFSPSESDEKSTRFYNKLHKHPHKTKEKFLETIQQLTQQKSELQREVEKVKNYFDKQKSVNLMLKAKQLELSSKKENQNVELSKSVNLSLEPVQAAVRLSASANQDDDQLRNTSAVVNRTPPWPSSVADRTVVNHQHFDSPSGPLGSQNEFSLPDLNVALDESYSGVVDSHNNGVVLMEMEMQRQQQQQNMMNKALAAAQARQKRLQIQRLKHSVTAAANKRPISLLDSTNKL